MEEALRLQAEEVATEQYRCLPESSSSVRIECQSYDYA